MRILISAYACEPGKGSEPEVGFQIALAAAAEHEVWLITRSNNLPAIEAFLADHPLRDRVHLVGLDVGGFAKRLKKRGSPFTLHWYYDKWQRRLSDVATSLDDEFDFDVVHHATFATYWTRTGIAAVNKPLVWGPVGGAVKPPLRLLPVMGFKGALSDLVRVSFRPVMARVSGSRRTARHASVILAQNPETASLLHDSGGVMVLPNALLAAKSIGSSETTSYRQDANPHPSLVMAGRLIGLKAPALALLALAHIDHPSATLSIYGEGPQRDRLVRLAVRLGIEKRVQFHGAVPRAQLLAAISSGSVLLHPALHEEAGFVVAEALALGIPLIALDRGGPPVVGRFWPLVPSRFITPSTPAQTARQLALAIDEIIGQRVGADPSPAQLFQDRLITAYARAAAERAL